MVSLWNDAAVAPLLRTDYGGSPENRHDPYAPRRRRVVRHRAGPGFPLPGVGPAGRPGQGPLRRAGDRVRNVGLPVPLLPRVRPGQDAAARLGVRPGRQDPVRVHQPAPLERAQERRIRGGGRVVRRAAGALLADARSAVPPPGPVGHPRLPPTVSPRARRFGRAGHSAAGPLRRVRGDGRRRPRGRRARPALGRDEYAYFLYPGRPARGRGTGHGLPDGIGLDLPDQDGGRGALMGGARPSFIYRLSMRLAQRALPFAARFDKKLARGLEARRGVTDRPGAWARADRAAQRPPPWGAAAAGGEGPPAQPVLGAGRAGGVGRAA